ncbi:MAG TPA: purine-nucleoside phosphorylase [Candidatus Acidoferrales bacterium]|jgi:purine-nucleoside phosphorylase|nr:purine-nucleoside phosphorylase [Candidatus Acidoferrales bacterium]
MSPSRAKGPAGSDEFAKAGRAAKFILSKTKLRPRIALILGSGLGAFADEFANATRIPYGKIPGFPRSTIEGHAGTLVIGKVGHVPIAAMQGRVHFYEGYPLKDVVFPMRVFGRLGIRSAILTNAAGAINRDFNQGALVVIRDHMNLQGSNPLIGSNDKRFGPRFPDMSQAYYKPYREFIRIEAGKLGIPIHEGVYAALSGPSFETPAEIRYFKMIGADMVGMSTVPEVIVARHMGLRVLGISCVTNMAAGILDQPINHEEVLETGERVRGQFVALLRAVIPRIATDLQAAKIFR